MGHAGSLLLALTVAYGCAVIAPLIRWKARGKPRVLAAWCVAPEVLACPLLIPAACVGLRAVSAVTGSTLARPRTPSVPNIFFCVLMAQELSIG